VALFVLLCLILGLLCFAAAAFGVAVTRVNLVTLGLAFWILTDLVAAWPR